MRISVSRLLHHVIPLPHFLLQRQRHVQPQLVHRPFGFVTREQAMHQKQEIDKRIVR